MNIRIQRLANDFQDVSNLVATSQGRTVIDSTEGNPPYCYVIKYYGKGIESLKDGKPKFRNEHRVKIELGSEYPSSMPTAEFLTPIFHPNIWQDGKVCFGYYWSISQPLTEVVTRVEKLIQYSRDIMNLDSPANIEAKKWLEDQPKNFSLNWEFKTKSDFSGDIFWNDLQ